MAYAELGKYQEVSQGFFVPASTKVAVQGGSGKRDSLSITLDLESIKPAEISEQLRAYLFERRPPRGIKHIRSLVNGRWIEEPQ
jgi:hypothetical protein